ncbi:MAG: (2Fe-2S) ferredoxin domain-containing protein [Thermodesulfobacteriota bacterium]|nr:(2Fe-2S) ferredoxin domain-containing protein [Thermodesulfobacteriota bacterium]
MRKPQYHLFVCASFRASGESKGMCSAKGATDFIGYIENEILDRSLDAQITSTGCMKMCDNGPVMVIYPENIWYGGVESEEIIDEILDALEDGGTADEYLL